MKGNLIASVHRRLPPFMHTELHATLNDADV